MKEKSMNDSDSKVSRNLLMHKKQIEYSKLNHTKLKKKQNQFVAIMAKTVHEEIKRRTKQ